MFGTKSGCVLYADATYTRVYTVIIVNLITVTTPVNWNILLTVFSDSCYEENSIQTKRARQDRTRQSQCPPLSFTVTVDSNVSTTYKWRDVSQSDDDSRKFEFCFIP